MHVVSVPQHRCVLVQLPERHWLSAVQYCPVALGSWQVYRELEMKEPVGHDVHLALESQLRHLGVLMCLQHLFLQRVDEHWLFDEHDEPWGTVPSA